MSPELRWEFLGGAQALTGACRNRMDSKGNWVDQPGLQDAWGRCVWGLGTAAAHSDVVLGTAIGDHAVRARGAGAVTVAVGRWRSPRWAQPKCSRSTPRIGRRVLLIIDYAASVAEPNGNPAWPWPEPRLTYANAVLPEAMIAAGAALEDATLRERGLALLAWLLDCETGDGHLSPTPVARQRSPGRQDPPSISSRSRSPSLADACARAAAVDGDSMWPDGVPLRRPRSRAPTTQGK